MFTWFYDAKTRAKLFLGFGLLIAVVVAIALVGTMALRTMSQHLTELHDDHYRLSVALVETQSKLNAVRAHLVTMTILKDRALQEDEHKAIRELSKDIDASFKSILAGNADEETKARVRNVKEIWEEFRSTRDAQLIPLILDGKTADAQSLAMGIQRERYTRFAGSTAEIVRESRSRALQFKEDGDQRYSMSLICFLGGCAFAVFLSVFLALFYTRIIAHPLMNMVAVVEKIAMGDLTVAPNHETRDELGRLGEAMRRMVERLHGALSRVQLSATQVASASQQLSASGEELSSGAQEQASSLEETAASLEEITSTVKQNAENALQAHTLSIGSRDTAEKGGQVARQAVEAMQEIMTSSRRITEIISAIDEIAFQTNLLALNAAVEAARAGEQGRGFAVVAAEVRSLSQRSAAASKEIKGLIQDTVTKVETGGELVNKSGQRLDEIVTSVRRVTDLMAEIAATSQEQSSGINQVNRAVAQMDVVVQQNAAQTEQMSSTAQSLSDQAGTLQELIGQFKLGKEAAPGRPTQAPPPRRAASLPPAAGNGPPKAPPRGASIVKVHPVESTTMDKHFKEF